MNKPAIMMARYVKAQSVSRLRAYYLAMHLCASIDGADFGYSILDVIGLFRYVFGHLD